MIVFWLLSIVYWVSLHAFVPTPQFFAAFHQDTSVLVDNCVYPVTGDYIMSEKIAVKGAQPLEFDLRYLSTHSEKQGLFQGWFAKEYLFATSTWKHPDNALGRKANEYDMRVCVLEEDCIPVDYFYQKSPLLDPNSRKNLIFRIDPVQFLRNLAHYGYSNVASQYSSRYNSLEMDYKGRFFTIKTPLGKIRKYKRLLDKLEDVGQKENFLYRLEEEILPNKNRILYIYDSLYTTRLSEIQAKSADDEVIFSWIRFHFLGEKQSFVQIQTSDGQMITYGIQNKNNNVQDLSSILTTKEPEKKFVYHSGTSLLDKRILPEGNTRSVGYCRQPGIAHKKVAILSQKITNEDSLIRYSFKYYPGTYGKTSGYTEVYDAQGNKTIYRYDSFLRIESIEKYYLEQKEQILSHKDIFCWGEDPQFCLKKIATQMHLTTEQKIALGKLRKLRYLLAKSRIDGEGNCLSSTRYFYDKWGNIQETRYYGNISGKSAPIALDNGLPDNSNAEYRFVRKTYSQDGKNLLLLEKRDGMRISYSYDKTTHLLASKIASGQNLVKRTFYDYDQNAQLVRTIQDDGRGSDKNNLTNVKNRYITKNILRSEGSFIGLIDTKEKWCYDVKDKKDIFIGKVSFKYDALGNITQKDIYDNQHTKKYDEKIFYDHKGRPRVAANALYSKLLFYDEYNRPVGYEETQGKRKLLRSYDVNGNLLLEEAISKEGVIHYNRYFYDSLGRLLHKKNHFNHTISYEYSRLGKTVKCLSPSVVTLNKVVRRPFTVRNYDCNGCLIEEFQEQNQEKLFKYNLDGNLIYEENADETVERRYYDLAGRLDKIVDVRGATKKYEYDGFGRCISEKVLSPSKKLVAKKQRVYSTFHLLEETDEQGNRILYEYNAAGQKIAKKMGKVAEFYQYDTLGRLEKVSYQNAITKFHEEYERDLLGRVIEKRIQEDYPRKRVVFREGYLYDAMGQCISTISYVNNEPCCTKRSFDGFLRLQYSIDPEGRKTDYQYDTHRTENNLILKKCTMTKPSGLQIIQLEDALGRVVSCVKKQDDTILEEDNYVYDLVGNLIEHNEVLYARTGDTRVMKNCYKYNNMHRVATSIEFAGTPRERKVHYEYTPSGKLEGTFKANGVVVTNEYDFKDRLVRISSNDNTVDYGYFYNQDGKPTGCKNYLKERETQKVYNRYGQLVREKLENGLSIRFSYDLLGRKEEVRLPDNSYILYTYDPIFLSSIARYDAYNQKVFSNEYLQYDLAGNILRERSAFDTHYIYDRSGKLIEKNQEKFQQKIVEQNSAGGIETLETTIDGNTTCEVFLYDALGIPSQESGVISKDYSDWIRKPLWGTQLGNKEHHQEFGKKTTLRFVYDENGNVAAEILGNKTILYHYDALDRLVCYCMDGEFNISFDYDGYHRRIAMHAFAPEQGGWRKKYDTQFLYDDNLEIGRYQNGSLVEVRVLENNKEEKFPTMLYLELYDEAYYPLQDFFGNTVGILSENLLLADHSNFTLFGEEVRSSEAPAINPWRFASSRSDPYSENMYYEQRCYSPQHGMWITQNPRRFYQTVSRQVAPDIIYTGNSYLPEVKTVDSQPLSE